MFADVGDFEPTIPSGSSFVKDGDNEIRRFKGFVKDAWEEEHYFLDSNSTLGSGVSGGQHKPGSSRVSYGDGPAPLTDDEGRLFYDVDDGVLVLQGSSATTAISHDVSGGAFRSNGTQVFPSGSTTTVWLNAASFDPDDMLDSDNSAVGVVRDGLYTLTGTVELNDVIALDSASDEGLILRLFREPASAPGSPVFLATASYFGDGNNFGGGFSVAATEFLTSEDSIGLTLFNGDTTSAATTDFGRLGAAFHGR